MRYIKTVLSGSRLEVYGFERPPIQWGKRRSVSKSNEGKDSSIPRNRVSRRDKSKGRSSASIGRAKRNFIRLVLSNLERADNPVFASFTYAENMQDIRRARRDFNAFNKIAKSQFGETFSCISVAEYQTRGAVHFHALIWGIPTAVARSERDTRMVAGLWGKGFVFLKETDGHAKLSSYLVKYFSKAMGDPRLFGKKLYICSRNVLKPIVDKGALLSVYFHLSTYRPLYKSEFMTPYLGKGRYRRLQEIIVPTYENHLDKQARDNE